MLLYQSKTQNPYFNIATEEYFLKNFDKDFFYLYINEPSIIVGKHQNTIAEINVPFAFENNFKVVRRLSGGGTVFHDTGNINYCFIQKGVEGYLVDFKKYTEPILNTLKKLGVNAYLKGKSDLLIDNLKFSGNAEHVFRRKVLHHGTLLFASELDQLNKAIKADWSKFNDKAVRSKRSMVTNIVDNLLQPITIDEFKSEVLKTVLTESDDVEFYQLTKKDEEAINKLVREKYSTWEWNFGYSPKYEFVKTTVTDYGELSVIMKIEKGLIRNIQVTLNNQAFSESSLIELAIIDTPHHYLKIRDKLSQVFENNQDLTLKLNDILELLF